MLADDFDAMVDEAIAKARRELLALALCRVDGPVLVRDLPTLGRLVARRLLAYSVETGFQFTQAGADALTAVAGERLAPKASAIHHRTTRAAVRALLPPAKLSEAEAEMLLHVENGREIAAEELPTIARLISRMLLYRAPAPKNYRLSTAGARALDAHALEHWKTDEEKAG
jgi:hypothetical protein